MRKGYDIGSVVSVLGGVVGMGGVSWAAGMVWMAVWDEAKRHAGQAIAAEGDTKQLVKRVMQAVQTRPTETSSPRGAGLQPLVHHLSRQRCSS